MFELCHICSMDFLEIIAQTSSFFVMPVLHPAKPDCIFNFCASFPFGDIV